MTGFEWGTEKVKALQHIQNAAKAVLPRGPYGPGDPMVFEGSMADRGAVWSLR